jgi:hypothetical protein
MYYNACFTCSHLNTTKYGEEWLSYDVLIESLLKTNAFTFTASEDMCVIKIKICINKIRMKDA